MTEPNDPSELWVVLHKSGRPASVWSEHMDAVDAAAGWNAHVTPYVPASELTAARERVAELDGEVFALRSAHAEALRASVEIAWEEGYWAAEQDRFKRLSPNPYSKPAQEST